eukprot:gene3465-4353_t
MNNSSPNSDETRAMPREAQALQEEQVEIGDSNGVSPVKACHGAAAHHLIPTLREAYADRADKRISYLQLIAFIIFLLLYFLTLEMQSSPSHDYAVREGILEALGPQDLNGEPRKMFVSHPEVYDWLRKVTTAIFVPMKCGDTFCDKPEEFPAFAHHGCQADCGVMNATAYTVVLEPRFTGSEAVIQEALRTVTYNLCTDDPVAVCWWEEPQTFRKNFLRHLHGDLRLPDANWNLMVYDLVPSQGLVVGGIALDSSDSDLENMTAADTDAGRRLKEVRRPGPVPERRSRVKRHLPPSRLPPPSPTSHGVEPAFKAEAARLRVLSEEGGSCVEGTSATAAPQGGNGSETAGAGDSSASASGFQSEWSLWQEHAVAAMMDVEVRSAEYCRSEINTLAEQLVAQTLNCDTMSEGKEGYFALYCCPVYKALLEGNCWCTVAVLEDWSDISQAFVAHDSYFPAALCHEFFPSEYPPLIQGPQCPILPPKLHLQGLNPTACHWLNLLLFGEHGERNVNYYGQTEWLTECAPGLRYAWRMLCSWDIHKACKRLMAKYLEYDCYCFSCAEPSALDVYMMEVMVRAASVCGLPIQRVHPDCHYDDSRIYPQGDYPGGCEAFSDTPTHIRYVADSLYTSKQLRIEYTMWQSSVADGWLTLHGDEWNSSLTEPQQPELTRGDQG